MAPLLHFTGDHASSGHHSLCPYCRTAPRNGAVLWREPSTARKIFMYLWVFTFLAATKYPANVALGGRVHLGCQFEAVVCYCRAGSVAGTRDHLSHCPDSQEVERCGCLCSALSLLQSGTQAHRMLLSAFTRVSPPQWTNLDAPLHTGLRVCLWDDSRSCQVDNRQELSSCVCALVFNLGKDPSDALGINLISGWGCSLVDLA